jgi:hypothetical protein
MNAVKQVIVGILEKCGDIGTLDFGEINLNDIVNVEAGLGLLAGGVDVFDAIGLQAELISSLAARLADPANGITKDQINQDLKPFLDDLFSVLSSSEFLRLLDGSPNRETMEIIGCLTKNKFSNLQGKIDEDFFQTFGSFVNITQLENLANVRLSKLCADEPQDALREKLLTDKDITPEEINEQVQNAKARKLKQLEGLVDLLQTQDLSELLPSIFCGEDGNGLVPRNPPSFMFTVDQTMNSLYDGVEISFAQELTNFPFVFTEPGIAGTATKLKEQLSTFETGFAEWSGNKEGFSLLGIDFDFSKRLDREQFSINYPGGSFSYDAPISNDFSQKLNVLSLSENEIAADASAQSTAFKKFIQKVFEGGEFVFA